MSCSFIFRPRTLIPICSVVHFQQSFCVCKISSYIVLSTIFQCNELYGANLSFLVYCIEQFSGARLLISQSVWSVAQIIQVRISIEGGNASKQATSVYNCAVPFMLCYYDLRRKISKYSWSCILKHAVEIEWARAQPDNLRLAQHRNKTFLGCFEFGRICSLFLAFITANHSFRGVETAKLSPKYARGLALGS